MPTLRKRIGFLPTEEVKNIIDKICLKNNLSQSKVTGILVEEALKARNLYKSKDKEFIGKTDLNDELINSKNCNKIDQFSLKNSDNEEDKENKEYNLIKEYLNYKNFKNILSIVQSESWGSYKNFRYPGVTPIKQIVCLISRANLINTINIKNFNN